MRQPPNLIPPDRNRENAALAEGKERSVEQRAMHCIVPYRIGQTQHYIDVPRRQEPR